VVGGSTTEDLRPCSFQRQMLYTTENLVNRAKASNKIHLTLDHRNEIIHVARRITKWLMQVPVNIRDWVQLVGLSFKSELELDEDRDRSNDVVLGRSSWGGKETVEAQGQDRELRQLELRKILHLWFKIDFSVRCGSRNFPSDSKNVFCLGTTASLMHFIFSPPKHISSIR